MRDERGRVVVIDPAARTPEVECFNRLALTSPLPCTYHLPALLGMQSLADEDPAEAAALIILGSAASVHDRLPWQAPLEAWLMPVLERGVPTLGICYGHQLLAFLFGGEVGFAFPDQIKKKGLREIDLEGTPAWPGGRRPLVVSHREAVVRAPASMRVAGRSADVPIEALAHARLPIWSVQAHPEAVPAFLRNQGIEGVEARQLAPGHALVESFLARAAGKSA